MGDNFKRENDNKSINEILKVNKKWSTRKKVAISIFLLLSIVIIIVGIFALNFINKYDRVTYTNEDISVSLDIKEELKEYTDTNHLDQIINIALFGIDAADGATGRSDSIMILSIDPIENKLKISSIMRDSYVDIDGYGKDKINHAFAYGDSVLALKTINDNFELNVENFLAVNFTNMPKIINKLGGIDINITEEEVPFIPDIMNSGINHLNGNQALSYSRIRYATGNDYQRTSRHRTILSAIFKKVMTISPTKYPSLLNEFLPLVQTNFSATKLLSLANTIYSIGADSLIEDRFPRDEDCDGQTINGIFYILFDIDKVKNDMRNFIYSN